jgi:hypothetical protein
MTTNRPCRACTAAHRRGHGPVYQPATITSEGVVLHPADMFWYAPPDNRCRMSAARRAVSKASAVPYYILRDVLRRQQYRCGGCGCRISLRRGARRRACVDVDEALPMPIALRGLLCRACWEMLRPIPDQEYLRLVRAAVTEHPLAVAILDRLIHYLDQAQMRQDHALQDLQDLYATLLVIGIDDSSGAVTDRLRHDRLRHD